VEGQTHRELLSSQQPVTERMIGQLAEARDIRGMNDASSSQAKLCSGREIRRLLTAIREATLSKILPSQDVMIMSIS